MITVKLSTAVTQCYCCGKSHLKRTLEITVDSTYRVNLGVTCAGRWFEVNLSGNPWYAADRLKLKLVCTDRTEFDVHSSTTNEQMNIIF